MGRGDVLNH